VRGCRAETLTRRPATRQRGAAGGGPDALGRLNDSIEAARAALKDLRSEMSRGSRDLLKDLDRTLRDARKNLGRTRRRIANDLDEVQLAARGNRTTTARSAGSGPRRGARPGGLGARRSSPQRNSTAGPVRYDRLAARDSRCGAQRRARARDPELGAYGPRPRTQTLDQPGPAGLPEPSIEVESVDRACADRCFVIGFERSSRLSPLRPVARPLRVSREPQPACLLRQRKQERRGMALATASHRAAARPAVGSQASACPPSYAPPRRAASRAKPANQPGARPCGGGRRRSRLHFAAGQIRIRRVPRALRARVDQDLLVVECWTGVRARRAPTRCPTW
jgi:hypothetical protein